LLLRQWREGGLGNYCIGRLIGCIGLCCARRITDLSHTQRLLLLITSALSLLLRNYDQLQAGVPMQPMQ